MPATTHRRPHRPAPVRATNRPRPTPPLARFTHTVGTYPSMRMPHNTGAILLHTADLDPEGGLVALTGTWHPRLSPGDTRDGDLVLQLLAPTEAPDDGERVDVRLWLSRRLRWHRLRTWTGLGPGWPHDIAPLAHAALDPGHTTTA